MLSKFLLIPFVLAALVFVYFTWEVDYNYMWWAVGFAVASMAIYMLGPQINWWWYQRRPPELHAGLRHFINTHSLFYQNLTAAEKTRFRHRMALYMEANEFMAQGMESVPADLKGVAAASAVQLTFGLEDYLLNKFEHIIIYPHPFPSPQHPEQWHASEIFEEDGVIMFSAEQLMASFLQPKRYFHIGLYEYARALRRQQPTLTFPAFDENSWPQLQLVSGFTKDLIEKWVGLKNIDPVAVAVAHFFVFPERFKVVLPGEYEGLAGALRVGRGLENG
ncbi:MAG: zinc-dependent peptidase [Bacteroidetes bacterium]|nr:zinc-dependent peptidase [Bacteroidota bacterium]